MRQGMRRRGDGILPAKRKEETQNEIKIHNGGGRGLFGSRQGWKIRVRLLGVFTAALLAVLPAALPGYAAAEALGQEFSGPAKAEMFDADTAGRTSAKLIYTGGVRTSSIPERRQLPRLVDDAELLDREEAERLLEKLDEISEQQQCDVAVVTVYGLDGKTPEAYADDFYDYNGYGMGTDKDGMLLLVDMESRKWWISTCGFGIVAVTDAGIDYISGKFLPDLSDGEYLDAFWTYASLCDQFLTQARDGKAYDSGHMPKEGVSTLWIPGSLLIGLALALVATGCMRAQLKSVRRQAAASNYVRPGSRSLRVSRDIFLYRTVTRTERPKDNDMGGSSTHTSSSGQTHGGGGGSF